MSPLAPWLFPLAAVLLAGIGCVLLVRGLFGRWFRAGGKAGRVRSCRKCRFDLSATEGHTCPECGHTDLHEAEHYAGRFRWPVAGLGLVLLLGALAVAMTPGVRQNGWLHLLPMGVQVRVFHLETNNPSFWRFTERLEGRNPMPGATSGIHFSFDQDDVTPRVLDLRASAFETAATVYARGGPSSEPMTKHAITVLDRFARAGLSSMSVERLIQTRGLGDHRVKIALIARDLTPTPTIREARRTLLTMPEDPMLVPDVEAYGTVRWIAVRTIALSEPDGADILAIAEYLAAPPEASDIANRGLILSVDAPPQVWQAYADFVKQGRIGSVDTLLEGIHRSEFVAAAAIAWVADQPPEIRARCLESLSNLRTHTKEIYRDSFDTLRSKIDWSSVRQSDLTAFVIAEDKWFTEWAIGVIRNHPNHIHRDALIAILGRSRFARPEAHRFATETLWPDESIPLHLRIRPILHLEGMPVDAQNEPADFTPYWEEILRRAALGDVRAAEAFDFSIDEATSPPPPTLVISIARRLATTPGKPEPWLNELALRIAGDDGHPPSLSGFTELVAQKAGHNPRGGSIRRELLTESIVLAETLAARWAEP